MIRTKATADTSGIDATIALLQDHDKVVATAGNRAYNRVAPEALAELRKEPGEAKKPIEWTSLKQRRYVMAMYREQGITEYTRSHKLSQSWIVSSLIEGKVFRIIFENTAPQAKFVYGSLAQNRVTALRFKQKFHTNTGWQDATDTATKWTRAMIEEFRREYKLEIQVRRRAYTRGRKR
jgi:hypothetical protein